MKNYVALAALVLATTTLSACAEKVVYLTPEQAKARAEEVAAEERERIAPVQRLLPPGCEFRDLGRYDPGFGKPWIYVTAVFCGKAVTTQSSWSSGKNRYHSENTTISE